MCIFLPRMLMAQAKNDVEGTMRVEKDINTLGNNQSTVDAYANHTWIIGTNVHKDIAHGKRFVVTDTLDNRLDYVGDVRVRVETADGQSVIATLEEDTHFVITVTDVDSLSEGKPSDTFKLELTASGMSAVAESFGENSFDDYMLRIHFDSRVNATSHTEENEIVIANVSGAILPETGGIGTWVFTVTGITLMLFSTVYLIAKKRKTA